MTFVSPMADVLSGGSLVMAVLAALFAIWQSDIAKAVEAPVKPDPKNRATERKLVASVMWRIVPLCAISVAAFVLLAFRSASIIGHAAACASRLGAGDDCYLDEAEGLLVLTETLLLFLAIAIGWQAVAVVTKRAALNA